VNVSEVATQLSEVLHKNIQHLDEEGQALRSERHGLLFANEKWQVDDTEPLSSLIDHTNLRPDATADDIARLCAQAIQYDFQAVCINSANVRIAAQALDRSQVRVAATVGFPLGAVYPTAKVVEALACVAQGSSEIDMVLHVGALKAGAYNAVLNDIKGVVQAVGTNALVKVIVETCLLTTEDIMAACLLCKWAGADYVKTSTGFSLAGANEVHVSLMRQVVGANMGVKAAGGIRCKADALRLVQAGASRLGTSRGPDLIK
jgi:deoxyribose-phosphate aldolase